MWKSVIDADIKDGEYFCLGWGGKPHVCNMRKGEWWRKSFSKRIVGITHYMEVPKLVKENKHVATY